MGTLPSSPTVVPCAVGQERRHRHHFQVGRRGMLLGTGAAIAGAALAGPGLVSAENDHNEDLSNPQPRPLPKPIPGVLAAPPFDFRVFGPGPDQQYAPALGWPVARCQRRSFCHHGFFSGLAKGGDVPSPAASDPSAFTGRFAPASARGRFSGRELGFSFRSNGDVTSDPLGYAEMGFESNGSLLIPDP